MPQTIAITESAASVRRETDRRLMARALELAAQGAGLVSPGPLVGCVIANGEGEILGEGFYLYEQLKHAETYALEQAGANAKGATAYVSLEPHAHHGRTPPCTDALINAGVSRVVAPIEDPNPKVSGKGFTHLRSANVEVSVGLLASEATKANEKYLHFMRTGRPFVHLKLAASLDGKIATRSGDSRWITGAEARQRVHQLRHEYDAILIGAGTAAADDPLLTDRSGKARRKPLVRVVLDERLDISPNSRLVSTATDAPLIIFSGGSVPKERLHPVVSAGVEVIEDTGRDLLVALKLLGEREIQSVLVEGGANVAGTLLDAGLVDKISFFIAPMIIGGCDAPTAVGGQGAESLSDAFDLHDVEITPRGRDIEVTGYPKRRGKGEEEG
ncbi:MAG TPA: bifunctional diaminohydroxyphosphoribosylaminopyrimidine deaminase/5-amino-6-(5-phosphoribosylamino)uracil reductase RibD [Pyrinomonadaceae bacterium]|nr:bifunctional diaminohydroxyphosphoribosylaminopyrimidine deaminase/5-amino-6-(5-phosphoribosylamino)uracil reductase RibD [Pyrinomonadaceae bacterium]